MRKRLAESENVTLHEVSSFEDMIDGKPVIEMLDCLYMTRIQKEHDSPEDQQAFAQIDFDQYRLNKELVARMKPYAPIMHPFPRDDS